MSRTKARVISSLRTQRCSQRRNKTNCTAPETSAAKTANQDADIETTLETLERACRGSACCAPTKATRLEKRARESPERGAQAGAERGEESAAVAARGIGAHVQQLRGDAQRAAEKIGVHAKEAGEPLQSSHLALKSGVGEGQLVLLRLASLRDSLLAREFVGQFAEAGGVARARQAILRGLLERIESAGERALRLAGHRGFVRRAEAGIVQNALILRQEHVSDLLLLAEELLVERVNIGALLISHLPRVGLCAASHGDTSKSRS